MFDEVMGAYGSRFLLAAGGVGIALVLLIGILWILRSRAPSPFVRGGKNRQPRLQVLDAAAVDTRRRLVLVRRDDVEHLIMIGGPTDIVIESRILQDTDEGSDHAFIAPLAPPAPRPEPVVSTPEEPPVKPARPVTAFEREPEPDEPYAPAPAPTPAPAVEPRLDPVAIAPAVAPAEQEPAAPVRGNIGRGGENRAGACQPCCFAAEHSEAGRAARRRPGDRGSQRRRYPRRGAPARSAAAADGAAGLDAASTEPSDRRRRHTCRDRRRCRHLEGSAQRLRAHSSGRDEQYPCGAAHCSRCERPCPPGSAAARQPAAPRSGHGTDYRRRCRPSKGSGPHLWRNERQSRKVTPPCLQESSRKKKGTADCGAFNVYEEL